MDHPSPEADFEYLRDIVVARAAEILDVHDEEQLDVFLSEEVFLEDEQLTAFFDDEWAQWTQAQALALAEALQLHAEVLMSLLFPTSDEILQHILTVTRDEGDLANGCDECQRLCALIDDADDREQLDEAARDVLAHLVAQDADERDAHSDIVDELLHAAGQLDRPAQLRVLAAAYEELAGAGRSTAVSALARYRGEFLSSIGRRAFDALAHSDDGVLDHEQMQRQLHCEPSDLQELSRAFSRAWRLLIASDEQCALDVVPVAHVAGRYRLNPQAHRLAQAILRAEAVDSPRP